MKNLVLSRRCIAPPGSALLVPLIVLVLSLFSYAQGQRITISGTVVDENGTSLPGVNVLEKGTSNGTITSSEGLYTIEAASNATLVFSFVGYSSLEIPVNNRSAIDASLEVEVTTLAEIVVTGYSTQNKADLTGATSVVDVEAIMDIPKGNPMANLTGERSGVVCRTDRQTKRSNKRRYDPGFEYLGDHSPLYIIDGVATKRATAFSSLNVNPLSPSRF